MPKATQFSQDPSLLVDELPLLAKGNGRIRPRARLLRTIGTELISSETVAIIELVRNSYDADATRLDLIFARPESPEDTTLEIRDNGHGMSRAILLGPWLEPAPITRARAPTATRQVNDPREDEGGSARRASAVSPSSGLETGWSSAPRLRRAIQSSERRLTGDASRRAST